MNNPSHRYAEGLDAGELLFQRCADCGAVVWYPRALCPCCASETLTWERSARLGAVYSLTTMHRRDSSPTNVALVDLDEGFRIMTRVAGAEPDDLLIGRRVAIVVEQVGDGPAPVAHLVGGDG